MRTPDVPSPIALIQEELYHEPWKMMVAVMMLNQTSIKQVRGVIWDFFDRFPDPGKLHLADPFDIAEMIRPLGLQNRRAKLLQNMSTAWLEKVPVDQLPGVGKYALDSWMIFVRREIPDEIPIEELVQDKELRRYVKWARSL